MFDKELKIQDKKQIQEIMDLLQNVATKYANDLKEYETDGLSTSLFLGSVVKDVNEKKSYAMKMNIAKGIITDTSNDDREPQAIYINLNLPNKLHNKKTEIIEENKKMLENGIIIKRMLEDILE